ncbi:MAG: hypothetical protein ACREIT_05595, partial [Tepidisphaeraceae bacterium]
ASAQEAQVALTEQLAEMRRRRLDEAFDADVRERDLAGLTPEWVIAHRQAYAAALDALEKQRGASRESSQTTQRNLEAVEAALERLRWLQSIQLKWVTLNGEISHERD